MKTIAVTGGIASGKSCVGLFLEQKGYKVIDTDIISRNLKQKGKEGYKLFVEIFGSTILNKNGEIDNVKVSEIVFNDKESLNKLNSVIHPIIEKEYLTLLNSYNKEPFVFVLVPLLFEKGWQNRFDKVWLVLSDEKLRIQRAIKRDGFKQEKIKRIINNQVNHEKFINLAHNVLYNNSSEEEFKVQIEKALKTL